MRVEAPGWLWAIALALDVDLDVHYCATVGAEPHMNHHAGELDPSVDRALARHPSLLERAAQLGYGEEP